MPPQLNIIKQAQAEATTFNTLVLIVNIVCVASADSRGTDSTESQEETGNEDYILPDSSTRLLTETDLAGLSKEELRLARNEIYARHGRRFDDAGLQSYFDGKSWYSGTIDPEDFSESLLTETEKSNLELIQQYEQR